jgi:hypothetical protein
MKFKRIDGMLIVGRTKDDMRTRMGQTGCYINATAAGHLYIEQDHIGLEPNACAGIPHKLAAFRIRWRIYEMVYCSSERRQNTVKARAPIAGERGRPRLTSPLRVAVVMDLRQSELARRVALEVEFDQYGGLFSYYPRVMARIDGDYLRGC